MTGSRRTVPLGLTPAGATVVVACGACAALARLLRSPSLGLLSLFGVVSLVTAVALRPRSGIEAVRSSLPARVREGQVVVAEVEVHARRRVGALLVRERVPAAFGHPVPLPVNGLHAGERARHRYELRPARRGVFEVGPLVAARADPFGLTEVENVLQPAVQMIVHPAVEPVHDRIATHQWQEPPMRPLVSRRWPSGFELYGLRDYVPGDDPRRIVWRVAARTAAGGDGSGGGGAGDDLRLVVREAEQGIADRVRVLLDADRRHHGRGTPSASFELAVRVTASLASHHIEGGLAVSVDTPGRPPGGWARGASGRGDLLDALAAVERNRSRLAALLARLAASPDPSVHHIVVTTVVDDEIARRLALLVRGGVGVLVVLVAWGDGDPRSARRAGGVGCGVVEVDHDVPLARVFGRLAKPGRVR